MASVRPRPNRSRGARRGDTLVECLVALAVAAGVFLPALSLLRDAARRGDAAARAAAAAASSRPAARTAASRLRLGLPTEEFSVRLAPRRVETRIVPAGGEEAAGGPVPRAVLVRTASSETRLLALPPFREAEGAPAP